MEYKYHSLTNRPASSSACSVHSFMNNNQYYRITAYSKENNFSCIIDSNGMFEKLWQFSAYLVSKGLSIIDASKLENIKETNISPVDFDTEHIFLRATCDNKVELKNNVIAMSNKHYTI